MTNKNVPSILYKIPLRQAKLWAFMNIDQKLLIKLLVYKLQINNKTMLMDWLFQKRLSEPRLTMKFYTQCATWT